MADENSAPEQTRFTGRVWLILLCALSVIVFLALVMPGVFQVNHGKRSFEIKKPIERLVFDSKGDSKVDISLSRDGHVHFRRTSSISRDSRLIERKTVSGKTLTIRSSCTGSRLGILRRCETHYYLRVPKKIALALHVHIGITKIHGVRGRLEYHSDAGNFKASGCNKRVDLSLTYGHIAYRNTCVPRLVKVKMRAGGVELTVPAGRYNVHPGGKARRPYANIIQDPSSRSAINVDIDWGGSIRITGVRP
ncbi:MAG TPA: hypothetical protein VII83_07855 [Gaiellaceae bacterium]|jgi:hypothetical protein